MLHAWMAPMALWLSRFDDGPQAALPALDRLALIDADLADPAMPPGPCPPADSAPWPADASAAYRWGVCYVVEGAQLGGAVLYRRLAAALAPHRLRYLQGDPAGPGPRWRAYLLALAEHVRTPADIAAACQGACDAFDRLRDGVDRHCSVVI
jgi:heme oxygenase